MLSFGTDGVRGLANVELTPELALALGRASVHTFAARRIVVGLDTRRSGPMLEAALAAGAASEGADVDLLGVVPTPAVALLSARLGCAGVVISASHNSFPDNGIKLFGPGGRKLTDAAEAEIERHLQRFHGHTIGDERPIGAALGTIAPLAGALDGYADAVCDSIEGRTLDGLRVVLDCANGAGSVVGPRVLERLGATVTVVNAAPDGVNINENAGSTSPDGLRAAVLEAGADVGLALDGDADRLLAVAADGSLVDGDEIIAILAVDRKHRDRLTGGLVVVTVMTNLGFRQAMAREGISVVDTKVGDRYVLDAMDQTGAVLGGEQSGHVIQSDLATTGDGLLTGVALLDVLCRSGRRLAELALATMTKLPQVLVNVTLDDRDATILDRLGPEIESAEARLGTSGRVLVRASGTEPKIRVMVEAPTDEQARREAEALATAVRRIAR